MEKLFRNYFLENLISVTQKNAFWNSFRNAILFKIITRMKLLFSNYLGDYSYSFQGSSELISITVTVSLFFFQIGVTGIISLRNSQEFRQLQLHDLMVFELKIGRREKTPTPKISALLSKRPVLLRANFFLTKGQKRLYYGHFCGKIHREGSCSKAAGGP